MFACILWEMHSLAACSHVTPFDCPAIEYSVQTHGIHEIHFYSNDLMSWVNLKTNDKKSLHYHSFCHLNSTAIVTTGIDNSNCRLRTKTNWNERRNSETLASYSVFSNIRIICDKVLLRQHVTLLQPHETRKWKYMQDMTVCYACLTVPGYGSASSWRRLTLYQCIVVLLADCMACRAQQRVEYCSRIAVMTTRPISERAIYQYQPTLCQAGVKITPLRKHQLSFKR